MQINPININSVNKSFGSSLTVFEIVQDGKIIFNRQQKIYDKQAVESVMKALKENLKMKVDTPAAKQLSEIVPDLYYKSKKKTQVVYLSDSTRQVNLFTGEHAYIYDNIFHNPKIVWSTKEKNKLYDDTVQELLKISNEAFAGFIRIVASTRQMVETAGKKAHELIMIDEITKALE